jgi:para-aminobenzoate synthetase component 1
MGLPHNSGTIRPRAKTEKEKGMLSRESQTSGICSNRAVPLVEELSPVPETMDVLHAFADCPGLILFESTLKREHVGRYSFLAADPFETFTLDRAEFGRDPFVEIRKSFQQFPADPIEGLPPFQGGAAGHLSYELGHAWERLPLPGCDEFQLPAMSVGLYDWAIAWDHQTEKAWIISHGFPETDAKKRFDHAGNRLVWVKERIKNGERRAESGFTHSGTPLLNLRCAEKLSPQFSAPGLDGLTSNFSRDGYLQAVERVIEYIFAGDIFQANLSQRLLYRQHAPPIEIYRQLRNVNPAPFAGFFVQDDWTIVSASPERFVCVNDREVETRPIKGTRQRHSVPEADLYSRDELRESEKDQAENVMIVDLLRNDLSRVCRPGSIRVPYLCSVEAYATVQHLVSEIRGELLRKCNVWNLFQAVFPGGSITGAPKVRAMEIIAELEPTVRGSYCGSLFYAGFNGNVDSSILIRTFTCRNGWIQCPVGGGIVAQSDPVSEYEETLHKAEGMLRSLK